MRFFSIILPQLIENGSTQWGRRGELSPGGSAGRICLETFFRVFPLYLGTDHYFRPGGGAIVIAKNCLHEKIAEINCLPQRCIWKHCLQRLPLLCEIWGIKKIVCAVSGGKHFASAESMVETFPGEKIMVRLLYKWPVSLPRLSTTWLP